MNLLLQTTISLLILFLPFEGKSQWTIRKQITGNGNVTTKTISTGEYDKIKGMGAIDIHLEKGNEGTIRVTTDDNLHAYIQLEVNDNLLIIKTKKKISIKTKKGIHVTVPFKTISEVTMKGSGSVDSKDKIKTHEFRTSMMGSGDMILSVETSQIEAEIMGSGDIKLSGSTTNLNVSVSGSGDFVGFGLTSSYTNASVSGSGDVKVVATNMLIARVQGSGDIIYKGNPDKKDVKTLGSGDISPY